MENTVKSFEAKQNMSATIRDREEKYIKRGYKAVCIDNGEMRELVDLRIGRTDTTVYACVWLSGINHLNCWAYGSGKAGGYGYHRASAAAESAFRAAGMVFDSGFSGCGDSATREAVQAAGEYLSNGLPVYVVEFYG